MSDTPPRFRPRPYPPPEFPPRRLPPFAAMPPAVFPAILGLLGLGLALRRALAAVEAPPGLAEAILGAVSALWLFAALGYGVKLWRRPGVLVEDLRVLPGRAGLATATMGMMAVAAALAPLAPGLARGVLGLGLALHLVLALALVSVMRAGPPEGRDVTPAWHLSFVGFIVGGLAAPALGWPELATGLLVLCGTAAVVIWGMSAAQFARRVPPAPLRPLVAIHVAPAALLGLVALNLGRDDWAAMAAALAGLIALALALSARWLLAAGFSPMWGALTFPLAQLAALLIGLGGAVLWPGLAVLVVAAGLVPWVAYRVLKAWATGDLARRTNAAVA